MRRWLPLILVPFVSTAVLASSQPAQAGLVKKPVSPAGHGKTKDKPVKGTGPSTPPPFDDGDGTGPAGPVVTVLPDGASEVDVRAGAWTQVPGLPVRVRGRAGSPSRVRVTVSSGADVQAQGGQLAVLVERVDGKRATASVELALQTTALGEEFRANWVHRLQVTTTPACVALQHPHANRGKHKGHAYAYGLRRRCTVPTDGGDDGTTDEVPVLDDGADGDLSFDAPAGEEITEELGPDATAQDSSGGGGKLLGVSAPMMIPHLVGTTTGATASMIGAGPGGSAGSFSATPLASSSRWQVGEQSGDFSTSYSVPVPAPPGGAAPRVTLSYSSQSVDGRTSSSNTQASWVGMGWELDPGSVQRAYGSCPSHPSWGDLCWKTDNAVLSLGGSSVPLYRGTDGRWHTAQDSGWRVQLKTGAPNGAYAGQYWVVTDTAGTQYWFGYGEQPVSGRLTRSAWTVPVYGDDSGEPCHHSSLSASMCMQAWKWNPPWIGSWTPTATSRRTSGRRRPTGTRGSAREGWSRPTPGAGRWAGSSTASCPGTRTSRRRTGWCSPPPTGARPWSTARPRPHRTPRRSRTCRTT